MNIKWNFLILAVLAACSIGSIGIFIAEKSLLGILAAIVILCGVMGFGFTQKKKLREAGKL
ncbi:YlaF family protein [Peribacillus simplex]|uniref:YlaF family protein n=1 Tax=Peribacillus simplex TaxID=1478 RepID=UPI00298DA243|nr:YlaF family protein [Peribacillus simplex]MDW7613179.1 YlaF family protein [Peribacillus simplex]